MFSFIKSFVLFSIISMMAQISMASGPMDRYALSTGHGYGIAKTEVLACADGREFARKDAEKVSEDEVEFFDKDGYILVDQESRQCEKTTQTSRCECKRIDGGKKYRCDFRGQFDCTEFVWHKDQ
ncbi:MAG: hypothetical protein AAF203_08175 [Pseudomonadota bacterium]